MPVRQYHHRQWPRHDCDQDCSGTSPRRVIPVSPIEQLLWYRECIGELLQGYTMTTTATDQFRTDSLTELRRTIRDYLDVQIASVGPSEITIRGRREGIREIPLSLRVRRLSAHSYGQDALATWDTFARKRLTGAL